GAANDAQRYYFANRLMYLDDQRQHLFGQVDHFEQTGLFFDELPENQPKPYDLEQEIKNVMSYRAKKKTELKKTANPDQRDRLKKRIAEYDQQLEQLRAQRHA
ncbi:MAG: hypothetical protein INR69_17445, partial [Mucilaginibacter polytrichastri]|nr:hypothetical protein [Mucilaginibacter polytrichastri]